MKSIQLSFKEFQRLNTERLEYVIMGDVDFLRKLTAIAGLVPNDFTEKFGRQAFTFLGWKLLRNWVFEFEGDYYVFASAKERGTTLEGTTTDKDKLRAFVDLFINEMQDNPSIQKWLKNTEK
jgi:hypothetical protein